MHRRRRYIWLYYRRLEEGRFRWPDRYDGKKNLAVTRQQLSWIPDGLNLCEPDAHREVLKRKLI